MLNRIIVSLFIVFSTGILSQSAASHDPSESDNNDNALSEQSLGFSQFGSYEQEELRQQLRDSNRIARLNDFLGAMGSLKDLPEPALGALQAPTERECFLRYSSEIGDIDRDYENCSDACPIGGIAGYACEFACSGLARSREVIAFQRYLRCTLVGSSGGVAVDPLQ